MVSPSMNAENTAFIDFVYRNNSFAKFSENKLTPVVLYNDGCQYVLQSLYTSAVQHQLYRQIIGSWKLLDLISSPL